MLISQDSVVTEARSYIGTKVRFKGRDHNSIDCVGLALMVGIAAGGLVIPPEEMEALDRYGWLPPSYKLVELIERYLRPADIQRPGDVGMFEFGARGLPMHLAVMAEFEGRTTMIHANPLVRPKRVTEHTYAGAWVARNPTFWRYPGIA